MFRSARIRPTVLMLATALAGCGPAKSGDANLDLLDAELTNTAVTDRPGQDPALLSALQTQIMVDPALTQQANADALRPADQPYSAQVPAEGIAAADPNQRPAVTGPLMKTPDAAGACPQCAVAQQAVTLGGLAVRQRTPGTAACVTGMRYSAGWAARMPSELPLYPQARLIEAAGNADQGCALRAASFITDAKLQAVLDWYYTKTTSVGYASEHQAQGDEHVLGGNRTRDQAAFILYASPRAGGGTQVDLIVNNGS